MQFKYQALDHRGEIVMGVIDFPNSLEAREHLQRQGLFVAKIDTVPRPPLQVEARGKPKPGFWDKPRSPQAIAFAHFVASGIGVLIGTIVVYAFLLR